MNLRWVLAVVRPHSREAIQRAQTLHYSWKGDDQKLPPELRAVLNRHLKWNAWFAGFRKMRSVENVFARAMVQDLHKFATAAQRGFLRPLSYTLDDPLNILGFESEPMLNELVSKLKGSRRQIAQFLAMLQHTTGSTKTAHTKAAIILWVTAGGPVRVEEWSAPSHEGATVPTWTLLDGEGAFPAWEKQDWPEDGRWYLAAYKLRDVMTVDSFLGYWKMGIENPVTLRLIAQGLPVDYAVAAS